MGRILAIDYGLKRTGLAVTDPFQIIATALETVETANVVDFLNAYLQREPVDTIVIGLPRDLNNRDTEMTQPVRAFAEKLKALFPGKPLRFVDERFTSKIARQTMVVGGMKKKDRQVKGNVDKISATIILQDFLASGKS